ncbi:cation diffusion facilitator family transporter [Brevibacillus humidisoli]|uniref:cation diffusion facilitator family transporter n=1 Tax=Brevibacillus humidisoli TaxID=2895522 RepID=UPI001E338008|nr:cation diffusion facilitator family transporter [Brevibacillus humidisoli]UFJ41272.1 cation diffusion facilitator family transporter [Brevibacillus humidisoli]
MRMEGRQFVEDRLKQGKRGVWISIVVYGLLACAKLGFGWYTASRALVADGWNSASDVLASLAILIGLYVAGKPADDDHRYGHFRAETAAALIAALLMAFVGVDLLQGTFQLLLSDQPMEKPDPLAIYVAGASALVMYGVYRINRSIAERTNNLAVLAAAYDNRSDALVSAGAAVGIAAAQWGASLLDPIVALIVSGVILKTAWQVGAEAVHSLMDGFKEEKLDEIAERIEQVEGVREIVDLRARYHGSAVHVDVTIGVDHHLNVVESHSLTEQVEQKLLGYQNIQRVYVHVEPALWRQS